MTSNRRYPTRRSASGLCPPEIIHPAPFLWMHAFYLLDYTPKPPPFNRMPGGVSDDPAALVPPGRGSVNAGRHRHAGVLGGRGGGGLRPHVGDTAGAQGVVGDRNLRGFARHSGGSRSFGIVSDPVPSKLPANAVSEWSGSASRARGRKSLRLVALKTQSAVAVRTALDCGCH